MLSWYGTLVENAKQVLRNKGTWFVGFVYREGNETAHLLAKYGLYLNVEFVWLKDPPIVISNAVTTDICNQ